MGVFEDTSVRFDGVHRQKFIGLGRNAKGHSFGSRLRATIYKVYRYDTLVTAYVLVRGERRYKKNEIAQNANWNYVAKDFWDNPLLTEEENSAQNSPLPIADDNPIQ